MCDRYSSKHNLLTNMLRLLLQAGSFERFAAVVYSTAEMDMSKAACRGSTPAAFAAQSAASTALAAQHRARPSPAASPRCAYNAPVQACAPAVTRIRALIHPQV